MGDDKGTEGQSFQKPEATLKLCAELLQLPATLLWQLHALLKNAIPDSQGFENVAYNKNHNVPFAILYYSLNCLSQIIF